jgi:hypothetical protein
METSRASVTSYSGSSDASNIDFGDFGKSFSAFGRFVVNTILFDDELFDLGDIGSTGLSRNVRGVCGEFPCRAERSIMIGDCVSAIVFAMPLILLLSLKVSVVGMDETPP